MSALNKYDPNELHGRFVELGSDWADKDAAANLLEETKKSVLGKTFLAAEGKSVAEREYLALSNPGYVDHLKAMVEARKQANLARVRFDAARTWFDAARTIEATRRAEASIR